jgi:mannosyltransferase
MATKLSTHHSTPRFISAQNGFLFFIIIVGALIRFFQLTRESLWFDESLSAFLASQPLQVSIQSMLQDGLQHSPLFYLLLRPFVSGGSLESSVRMLPAIAGVLAIPMIAILGEVLFSRSIGLTAAALLALNPFHIWYSREARMYSLLVLAAILCMYFFSLIIFKEPKPRYWIGLTISSAIAFNSHYFAFFIPLVQLTFIIATFKQSYIYLRSWTASMCLAALSLLPWITIVIKSGVYWVTSGTPNQTSQWADIPLTFWNFSIGYTQTLTIPVLIILLLFLVVLIYGLIPPHGSRFLLAIWLLLPITTTFLISFRFPMYMDRYLIVALPPFVLALANGLAKIPVPNFRRVVTAIIVICELVSLTKLFTDRYTYERADWRQLGSFLETNVDPIRERIVTLNYQDLIPLHFYYHGKTRIQPIIIGSEIHLPDRSSLQLDDREAYLWLIIPNPNQSNHLVGHCQPFKSEPLTSLNKVKLWREQLAPNLAGVQSFTCIRLERYILR